MFEDKSIFAHGMEHRESGALRAIAWADLTARINASRDLRQVMRREDLCLLASFSDAAAGYFSTVAEDKQLINPNALGERKPNSGIQVHAEGTKTGDQEK